MLLCRLEILRLICWGRELLLGRACVLLIAGVTNMLVLRWLRLLASYVFEGWRGSHRLGNACLSLFTSLRIYLILLLVTVWILVIV